MADGIPILSCNPRCLFIPRTRRNKKARGINSSGFLKIEKLLLRLANAVEFLTTLRLLINHLCQIVSPGDMSYFSPGNHIRASLDDVGLGSQGEPAQFEAIS